MAGRGFPKIAEVADELDGIHQNVETNTPVVLQVWKDNKWTVWTGENQPRKSGTYRWAAALVPAYGRIFDSEKVARALLAKVRECMRVTHPELPN